jgi:hypothetical protein
MQPHYTTSRRAGARRHEAGILAQNGHARMSLSSRVAPPPFAVAQKHVSSGNGRSPQAVFLASLRKEIIAAGYMINCVGTPVDEPSSGLV